MSKSKENYKKSTVEKGRQLEYLVADVYKQLGATVVDTNMRLSGQQLDVYAEIQSLDGFTTRVGIDCKNYTKDVGVNEVNKSAQKLALLRQNGHIDNPVLLAYRGFTPEAKSAANSLGVRTVTYSDLLRQVADFTSYLIKTISKYENTIFHKKGLYCSLHCRSESGKDLGFIDDFVPNWFSSGGRFLTILGDYGSGKTTFAERLFWIMSLIYLDDPLDHRIPVYIPLKRYRKEINIRSLITDLLLHEYDVRIRDFNVFKRLNEQGRILLIFDAFDEMATGAEEAEVIQNIREIQTLVSTNSQVLLTCRTHYFKDQDQMFKVHDGTTLYKEIKTEGSEQAFAFLSPFREEDVISRPSL
jgi:hypothetical protein